MPQNDAGVRKQTTGDAPFDKQREMGAIESTVGLTRSGLSSPRVFDIMRICAFTAALVTTITSGCGNTHATLDVVAPSTATAGIPFTVTVKVLYKGRPDTVINSHIHFTSSDASAVLPPDYYFTRLTPVPTPGPTDSRCQPRVIKQSLERSLTQRESMETQAFRSRRRRQKPSKCGVRPLQFRPVLNSRRAH